jgi:hypothetical protein
MPEVLATTYTDGWEGQWKPGLTVSANNVHLVWWSNIGDLYSSDIFYRKSSDNGVSWNSEARLTETNNSSHPAIGGYGDSAVLDSLGRPQTGAPGLFVYGDVNEWTGGKTVTINGSAIGGNSLNVGKLYSV